jgi:methylmalonyl-CoA decarboxylase subunit alpha
MMRGGSDGAALWAGAWRREIEAAEDPVGRRDEIEARRRAVASPPPFRPAEAAGQDIIDPADTRALLCEFVLDAPRVLATQLGPPRSR